jgi:hypothetical protein
MNEEIRKGGGDRQEGKQGKGNKWQVIITFISDISFLADKRFSPFYDGKKHISGQ